MLDWLLAGAAAFIGGLIAVFLGNSAVLWRMNQLEGLVLRLQNAVNSPKGVAARQEKSDRMMEAIAAVATRTQNGEDIATALKGVAVQYPDVALELAKKTGLKL